MDLDGLGFLKLHKKLKKKIKSKVIGKIFGGGSSKAAQRQAKKQAAAEAAAAAAEAAAASAAAAAPTVPLPAAIPGDPAYTTYLPPATGPLQPYGAPYPGYPPAPYGQPSYGAQPYSVQPYQGQPYGMYPQTAPPPSGYPYAPPPAAEPFYGSDPFAQGYSSDPYSQMMQPDPWNPWDPYGDGAGVDDASIYLQEEDALEGIFDSDFWKQKWAETVAWFKTQIDRFFAMKGELSRRDGLINEAIAAAESNPQRIPAARLAQLRSLRTRLSRALSTQREIEPKVTEQLKKIGLVTEQQASGLGIAFVVPIAIGAAAVAAMVTVGSLVIAHMQSSADLNRQIDLAAAGVLSAADIERIKRGGGDLLGLGNLSTLGMVAGGLFGLYLINKYLGSRSAA